MGLMPGDVIIRLDDEPVLGFARNLRRLWPARQPGSRVTLLAFRQGEPMQVALTLAKRPEAGDAPKGPETQPEAFSFREAGRGGETAASGRPPGAGGEARRCASGARSAAARAATCRGASRGGKRGTGQRQPRVIARRWRRGYDRAAGAAQAAANARPETGALPQPGAGAILSVAISPDGRLVLTGSTRGMKLWDIAARKGTARLQIAAAADVVSVAFSPDGRFAISAIRHGGIKLWEVATGDEVRSIRRQG